MISERPQILQIPSKLEPIITRANDFRYFILEGGRGSGKSQSVARWILYLGEKHRLRIVCGRETQNSIEESVYTVLVDLIREYRLNWDVKKDRLTNRKTQTAIRFRGFREQGAINIKGMEGVDVVWVEEAQAITKATLDILIPTIRKEKAKLFFTMNRFLRTDAVVENFKGRDDSLMIHIDYFENPYCPQVLKFEADACKAKNEKDYKHIWLGQPLDIAEDYLFNFDKLLRCKDIYPTGDLLTHQSILSIDYASGGGDLCVASLIKRISMTEWELAEQVAWDDPDTTVSVGKTITLYGQHRPDLLIVDSGGLGYPIFCDLSKSIQSIIGFDGGKTDKASANAGNNRAEMYLLFSEWVNNGWFRMTSNYTIKECETIKKKFHANGKIYIQSKQEAKHKERVDSQDRADSVAMAIFCAVHYLGKVSYSEQPIGMRVKRVNRRKPL